jgi:hypothetical protein
MYHGQPKPILKGLLEWGVTVFVKKLDASKLDRQVVEGHFVSYDEVSKGYRWRRSALIKRDV